MSVTFSISFPHAFSVSSSMLNYTALHYTMMVLFYTIYYNTIYYNTIFYNTIYYNTIYYTIHSITLCRLSHSFGDWQQVGAGFGGLDISIGGSQFYQSDFGNLRILMI